MASCNNCTNLGWGNVSERDQFIVLAVVRSTFSCKRLAAPSIFWYFCPPRLQRPSSWTNNLCLTFYPSDIFCFPGRNSTSLREQHFRGTQNTVNSNSSGMHVIIQFRWSTKSTEHYYVTQYSKWLSGLKICILSLLVNITCYAFTLPENFNKKFIFINTISQIFMKLSFEHSVCEMQQWCITSVVYHLWTQSPHFELLMYTSYQLLHCRAHITSIIIWFRFRREQRSFHNM